MLKALRESLVNEELSPIPLGSDSNALCSVPETTCRRHQSEAIPCRENENRSSHTAEGSISSSRSALDLVKEMTRPNIGDDLAQDPHDTIINRLRSDIDYDQLEKSLGKGPLRYAFGRNERLIGDQIDSLAPFQRACFDRLKNEGESMDSLLCDDDSHSRNDGLYLLLTRCSEFKYEKASILMKNWQAGSAFYLIRCAELKEQLQRQVLFVPSPELKTRSGLNVFYMRPSRYFPKVTPTPVVINNLSYVLQVMLEKEECSTRGIAFVANMKGWTRHNFSLDYCRDFMHMLEGNVVPAKVELFLIVDPPVWFEIIYNIIINMLSEEFAKKVKLVSSQDLGDYLAEGYLEFLPDDVEGGKCVTKTAVDDFIRYRMAVEGDAGDSFVQSLFKKVVTRLDNAQLEFER
mmetsp:Transcript_4598/g.13010  ORF Transcript_4598/g.13010 Transcript_4598/m.13010 type:complete len:404 (+) Transcript_4598:119-1330(+)